MGERARLRAPRGSARAVVVGAVAVSAALVPGRVYPQHDPFAGAISEFEAALAADVAGDGVGSLAAAVVIGAEVVWQNGLGWADPDRRRAAGPETIYRVGSITKPVTAMVMMRLAERGIIDLDEPVRDHVPELDRLMNRSPDHRPITFRDLASHTAGLGREPALGHAVRGRVRDWERKLVASLASTELRAPPGAEYHYSNIGYAILGLALQRAARRPFIELVEEHVLDPLGMRSSHFIVPRRHAGRVATGYVNLDDGTIDPRVPRAEHRGRGYKVPNGGLYSTVGDLTRLVMAMTGALGDSLLPATARATMLQDADPSPDDRSGYGLGFQLQRIGGTTIAGHSGTVAGYTAYLAFDPETRIGVVLLRNYNRGRTNLAAAATGLLLELREAARTASP